MKLHRLKPKWNIIFLIYAELADYATISSHPDDYSVDVKTDLDALKATILNIEVADSFNVFTIENVVQIKDGVIASDCTFIRLLTFDAVKKKNKQLLLKKSIREDFIQKRKDIQKVFQYIDKSYPAQKNLLITWDHGSAFGIFKKVLSDHPHAPVGTTPGAPPVSLPGAPPIIVPGGPPVIIPIGPPVIHPETELLQNVAFQSADKRFEILSQRKDNTDGIITFVRNNRFQRPESFFKSFTSDKVKEDESEDFDLLSNDKLALAITNGFKNQYVDVLMMFNCDMQNMHTCYSFRNSVKYLVAPEGAMTSPGYDYIAIANLIRNSKGGNVSGEQVATEAVNTFKQNYIKNQASEAADRIALFAVCLTRYNDKVIKSMDFFIKTLEGRIPQDTPLVNKLAYVRENCYAFAANLGYFLVDLVNFMQDINENFDDTQLKRIEKKLQAVYRSIAVGSAIGDAVYSDGPESLEKKYNRTPSGLTIYFPPGLQDESTQVMKNFIVPNAPFSTSLFTALNWRGFLHELYKNPD